MKAADEAALRRLIVERVAAWNDMAPESVPMDRPLADLGMSSRDAVALAGELSHALGRPLPSTLLWETPTGDALVARLCGQVEDGRRPARSFSGFSWRSSSCGVPTAWSPPP
jgi:phthiocerol/phenolphthiocerol synthesis type-I polyketide synthase A